MYIRHGKYRLVVLIPSLGIVIKVPRVWIRPCIKVLIEHVKGKNFQAANARLRKIFRQSTEIEWSPQRYLLKGFADNLREWRFWRETRHAAVPAVLLWLPFVSIHRAVSPLSPDDGKKLWSRLLDTFGEKLLMRDGHHFSNPDNFGIWDSHLVVVDYASPVVQEMLRRHGDELVRSFLYSP